MSILSVLFGPYIDGGVREGGGRRFNCDYCKEWVIFKKSSHSTSNLNQALKDSGWETCWDVWHGEDRSDVYRDLKWLCPSCAKAKRQRDKERRKAEQELIAKHTIEY
ncbi:MAG: hypothetical protein KKD77_23195 [Gammaproteobacteria bacterium]|nr:hypothetical protein [Gammaproteobacteria bacterium]